MKSIEAEEAFIKKIKGKKILYIATKNADYLRLQQEIGLIKEYASDYKVIVSERHGYLKRILEVYIELFKISLGNYDTVFIGFMAQMIVPILGWKFKNKEVVVDFFISIYDTLVDDRKKFKSNSMIAKILHRIDSMTLKRANIVVCDTEAHGTYFEEEFGIEKEKISVLYLEADRKYYHPMVVERPKKWENKFLVLYFGSILPVQGVEIILKAIELLKEEKNIHFLMIGPISKKYKKIDLDTVTYIDWLSQYELAKQIAYADLCLAGHFNSEIGKANRTIAGKTYIYKAMDKAVILGDSIANRELFKECEENNFYVSRGDSNMLARKIKELSNT